jgi:hypothetical protein
MIRLPHNDPWYDAGFEPYDADSRRPLTGLSTAGSLGVSSSDLRRFIDAELTKQIKSTEPSVVNGHSISKVNGRWRLVVREYRDGYAIFESESRAALERFARKL